MAVATQGNLYRSSYYFDPCRVKLVIIPPGRDRVSRDSSVLLTSQFNNKLKTVKNRLLTFTLVLL